MTYCTLILGVFTKLQKATLSFDVSVLLSVVRTEQLGLQLTYFHEIWYLLAFSKICQENSSFIKIGQE